MYGSIVQPDRWFLALDSGNHLPPYTDEPEAVNDFGVVANVTTAFLRLELDGVIPTTAGHTKVPSKALLAVGNASPLVASMSTGPAPTVPSLEQSDAACYAT